MSNTVERRVLNFGTELRADASGKTLYGYAARFGMPSLDLGGFREVLQKGCFRDALAKPGVDVRALYSHDSSQILARQGNGTLNLREDDLGLAFTLQLPNTSLGKDVAELVRSQTLSGMSFGFTVAEDRWADDQGNPTQRWGGTQRTIVSVADLFEVSVVGLPAYPSTDVHARSLDQRLIAEARAYLEAAKARQFLLNAR